MKRGWMRRSRAIAGAAAVAVAGRPGRTLGQPAPRLRLGAVASETFAEPLYAADSGAFARAGLAVDLTVFGSGAGLNQAAAGGALDVAICDPLQLMTAIVRGIPYAYFAGGLIHVGAAPTTVLCVNRSGPIRSAHDLEGQTIGIITLHSIAEFSIREWMLQQGADPAKARFVEITSAAMPPALARGTIAAAMLIEPFLSIAAPEVRVLANTYNAIAQRFQLNAFYARREWLQANPEVVRAFLAAVYETARWTAAHRSESAAILARYAKLEPDRLAAMERASYATSLDPRLLAPVIAIAAKFKAVDKVLAPADLIFSV